MSDLGVKGWVLNAAVDEQPQMVLDHERLYIGILVLLVDLLHQCPAQHASMMCLQRAANSRKPSLQTANSLRPSGTAESSLLGNLIQHIVDVGASLVRADGVHKADLWAHPAADIHAR